MQATSNWVRAYQDLLLSSFKRDVGEANQWIEPRVTFDDSTDSVAWSDLIRGAKSKRNQFFVVGSSGLGKTTLLRQTAVHLIEVGKSGDRQVLPILVSLRDVESFYPELGKSHDAALRKAIIQTLRPLDAVDRLPRGTLKSLAGLVDSDKCWLLLDGLESIQPRTIDWIYAVLERWNCHWVTTSRAPAIMPDGPFTVVTLAYWDWHQIKRAVAKALPEAADQALFHRFADQTPPVGRLLSNPRLLDLTCRAFRKLQAGTSAGTPTATEIFEEITHALLSGEGTPYANQHVSRRLLNPLAEAVWREFDPARCTLPTRLLSNVSADVSELERAGLLECVDVDRSRYRLPTYDFTSFLAAWYIAQQLDNAPEETPSILSQLSGQMYNPEWDHVFAFATGLTHDPDCLLALAVDRPDTITHRRHTLAFRMLRELPSSSSQAIIARKASIASSVLAQWASMPSISLVFFPWSALLRLMSPPSMGRVDVSVDAFCRLGGAQLDKEKECLIRNLLRYDFPDRIREAVLRGREATGNYVCVSATEVALAGIRTSPSREVLSLSEILDKAEIRQSFFSTRRSAALKLTRDAQTLVTDLRSKDAIRLRRAFLSLSHGDRTLLTPAVLREVANCLNDRTSLASDEAWWFVQRCQCDGVHIVRDGDERWAAYGVNDLSLVGRQIKVVVKMDQGCFFANNVPYPLSDDLRVIFCKLSQAPGACISITELARVGLLSDNNPYRCLSRLRTSFPLFDRCFAVSRGSGVSLRSSVALLVEP